MDWNYVLQEWLSPGGIVILGGGIIWGIQLNVAVMNLARAMTAIGKKHDILTEKFNENAKQQAQTAIILDTIERRLEELEKWKEEHQTQTTSCLNRIVALETRAGS